MSYFYPQYTPQNDGLLDYFIYTRQSGHTTLSIEGAKNYDRPFYIIGLDMRHAKALEAQIQNKNGIPISINQIHTEKYRGVPIPAFLDNGVIISQLEFYYSLIEDYKYSIEKMNLDIDNASREYYRDLVKQDRDFNKKFVELKKMSFWDRVFNFKKKMDKFKTNRSLSSSDFSYFLRKTRN
jgi:hypothetical protein